MSETSDGDTALHELAALAAHSFGSTAESIQALLKTIASQLGLRTSFLTEITPATGRNHILAAYDAPGGSGILAGTDLHLGDTY